VKTVTRMPRIPGLPALLVVALATAGAGPCDDAGGAPVCTVERNVVLTRTDHWPVPQDVPPLSNDLLLLTNTGEDTISMVRASDMTELFRAPVGLFPMQLEGPHHLVVDPAGRYLYVPLSNDIPGAGGGPHGSHGNGSTPGFLLRIDAATMSLVDSIPVDRSPGDIVLNRAGTRAYISHYDLKRITDALSRGEGPERMRANVAVVDTTTMTRLALLPTCAGPHGMAFNADETRLYVACALSDELAALDLTVDPPTVTRIPVGTQAAVPPNAVFEPYSISTHPTDGTLWVSCLRSRDLRILDPQTMTWSQGPTFDASPMFGVFTPAGHFLVPIRESGSVALVNATTRALQRPVLRLEPQNCQNAHGLELSADGQTAWMVCEGDQRGPGSVITLIPDLLAVATVTPVGIFPDSIRRVVLP